MLCLAKQVLALTQIPVTSARMPRVGVLHGDGMDMPSHLQDLLGCIQGEYVADAAGIGQVDIRVIVLLCHMPFAGGLADDLPLLPVEEGPYVEAGSHWVEPSQEDGQVVQSTLKQLSSIFGL